MDTDEEERKRSQADGTGMLKKGEKERNTAIEKGRDARSDATRRHREEDRR